MPDADDLLRGGDLDGARAALVEIVRARPQDEQARMFLFQLFAVLGEWQKARLQLTTLAQLSPEAQMLSVAYGQAIDAEQQRSAAWAGTLPFHVHGGQGSWADNLAGALNAFTQGHADQGEALRQEAFEAAPDTPGDLDGRAFEWIADADGHFGPCCEAIIAGQWGLLPFDRIERIESAGAQALRDIVWYPVEIAFRSGHSSAAMLPCTYPQTRRDGTPEEMLARATRWADSASGQYGIGQHLLTLSSGEDVDLLSLRLLRFD